MFDGIMGSKFSTKCKQALKNTTSRVDIIRKKKQAMLNFLKKDVADLLAQGHEQHAVNRIDGVVSESNNVRCYDLIGDFCECIAAHLPVMQKLKRECPPECVEAVATLIFAAARFSDLPELCQLRSLFTERYGSAMEPSVNAEFKEKVSKHNSLSMNAKLRLMQDIAIEFDVKWDSKNFGQRNAPAPAPAPVHPKQNVSNPKEQRPVDHMNPAYAKKVEEQNVFARQRADPYHKGGNAVPKEQELRPKQDAPNAYREEHKPLDATKYAAATNSVEEQNAFPRQRPDPYRKVSNAVPKDREPQPVARDIHVLAGSKSYYQPEPIVVRAEVKDVHSSSAAEDFRKKSHAEEGRRAAEIAYDAKRGTGGAAAGEVEKVNSASGFRASNMAPPPYVRSRDMDGASWDKAVPRKASAGLVKADGSNKDAGGAAIEEVDKAKLADGFRVSNMAPPYVKPRHMNGPSWEKAAAPQQGLDSGTTGKKAPIGLVKEDESDRALKEVRLSTKPSRSRLDDQSNNATSEEAADRANSKKEPNGAASPQTPTPAFFRPPPYLKPNYNSNAGNPVDYPSVADMTLPASGVRLHARSSSEVENHPVSDDYLATAERTPKPRSMRRNHRKPHPLVEDAGQPLPGEQQNDSRGGHRSIDDAVPFNGDDVGRIPHRRKPHHESNERGGFPSHQDYGTGIADDNAGRVVHEKKRHSDRRRPQSLEDVGPVHVALDAGRFPGGRYHQNGRQGLHHRDDEVDEDEKIDFLLMHYSRKGMPERNRQIKRVVSLPHEDSPKAARVPTRAVSSVTDEPGPNGRPVRHQLPDFDELAARIHALRGS